MSLMLLTRAEESPVRPRVFHRRGVPPSPSITHRHFALGNLVKHKGRSSSAGASEP